MLSRINEAFLRLPKRAETLDSATLIETFVGVANLIPQLTVADHQVLYGRRGTGKTHILHYVEALAVQKKDLAVYVELRLIGSPGGIYQDPRLPVTERGTRLLVDVLKTVYESLAGQLLDVSYKTDEDFSRAFKALDDFATAITEVRVVGDKEREVSYGRDDAITKTRETSLGATGAVPAAKVGDSRSQEQKERTTIRVLERGEEEYHIEFGAVARAMTALLEALGGAKLWILVDEWSTIPLDLQPLLGDMLRRALFPVRGLSIKIAAIEQRSQFQLGTGAGYMGIELGADASAALDLDDFMVFGNDEEKSKEFFSSLLQKHVNAVYTAEKWEGAPPSPEEFIRVAFTQHNAFDELVRAAEGVPRDAFNIIALAAMQADDKQVSVPDVRAAARNWYLRDKGKTVEANGDAEELLHWIVGEVIGTRRARAFLLQQGDATRDPLITDLYDARVLHLVKRGIAAHDRPGTRFNVYGLDYGCYVELISTGKAPKGMLPADGDVYVDVPPDDYRAIRRAILDLDDFNKRKRNA